MPRQRQPETPFRLNDPEAPRPQGHPDAPRIDGPRADAPHAPQPSRLHAARHADADRYPYADVKHGDFAHVKGEGVRHWGPGWQQRMAEDARIRAESLGYHKPDAPHAPAPAPDAPPRSTSESMAAEKPPENPFEHRWNDRVGRGEPLDISAELREKLGGRGLGIRNTDSGLSMIQDLPRSNSNPANAAQRMPRPSVDPKRFTVEVHGSPNGVYFNGKELSAKELAEIIKGAPGYKHGEPVRLLSCQTGADLPDGSPNFAQQLSKELGVEVLAPNKDAWVDNFGNMYASGSRADFDVDASGTPQPRFDEPGQWVSFSPDGTKAVHDSPFPPGHEPEWTRFGHQADAAHQRGYGDQPPKEFQHPGGPAWSGWHSRPDAYNEPIPGHLSPTGEFVPHGEFDVHGKWIPHGQVDNLNRWVPVHLDANGQLAPNGHYDQSGGWVPHGRTDEFGRWVPVHRDANGYHDLGRYNPQTHQWEPTGYVDRNTGQFVSNNPPQQMPHAGSPQAGPGHQSAPNAGQAQQPRPAAPQQMTAQSGYGSHQQAGQHPVASQQSPYQQPMQQQAPQQPNYQQQPAPNAGQPPQQPAAPRTWQQPAPPNAGQQPPAAPNTGQRPQPMQQQPAQPPQQPQQPLAANPQQFGQQPPPAARQQQGPVVGAPQQGMRQQPPAANAQQTPQQPNQPAAGAQPATGPQRQAPQFPASRQPSAPQQPAPPPARPAAPQPADVSGPRPAPAAPNQPAPPVDVRGPRMDGPSPQTRAPSTDAGGQPQTPGSSRPAQPPADVNGPRQPQSPEAPRRPDSAQGPGTSPQTPAGHRSDAPPADTNGPGPKPADAPHTPETGKPADTTTPRTDQQAESWRNDFEPERSNAPETPAADSPTWRNDFEPSEPTSPPKKHEDVETEAPAATDATTNAPKHDADDWSPFDPKPDPASSGHSEADAPKHDADDWTPFDPKPDPAAPGHSEADAPKQDADDWSPFDPPSKSSGTTSSAADEMSSSERIRSLLGGSDSDVDWDTDVPHADVEPDVQHHDGLEQPGNELPSDVRAAVDYNRDALAQNYLDDPDYRVSEQDRQRFHDAFPSFSPNTRKEAYEAVLPKMRAALEEKYPRAEYPEVHEITDEELMAIRVYSENGYRGLNNWLREKELGGALGGIYDKEPFARCLTSALNRLPSHEGWVRRNIGGRSEGTFEDHVQRYAPGKVAVEQAFSSSSDPKFSYEPLSGKPLIRMEVYSKSSVDIDFLSGNRGESEFLFHGRSYFRTLEAEVVEEMVDGKLEKVLVVRAEEVPSSEITQEMLDDIGPRLFFRGDDGEPIPITDDMLGGRRARR